MVSTSQSIPPSNYYKHSSETFIASLPPQDQVMQPNDCHDMQHGFRMWLGQEDYFSPFATNFGDTDDLLMPAITNFGCPSSYLIPPEDSERDQYFPAMPECDVYTNCSSGYGEHLGESCFEVGHYHVFANGEDRNASSIHENCVSPNNCAATTMENWGLRDQPNTVVSGENSAKVGRYTVEEKRARILRYLKKRNQRNFNKTIKYACRKALADRRVRIHGRFAKNPEDDQPLTNRATSGEENLAVPCSNTDKNEESYEEEWLQQAMRSLISVPCIPSWHGQAILK